MHQPSLLAALAANATHKERIRREGLSVRPRAQKQVYSITLTYPNSTIRLVRVKAASREAAERRALKRNPSATGVKPNA